MRKFSLVLAAAVMAVGLAVSGGVWADSKKIDDNKGKFMSELIMEGNIIYQVGTDDWHSFTIEYGGELYWCIVGPDLYCWKHS